MLATNGTGVPDAVMYIGGALSAARGAALCVGTNTGRGVYCEGTGLSVSPSSAAVAVFGRGVAYIGADGVTLLGAGRGVYCDGVGLGSPSSSATASHATAKKTAAIRLVLRMGFSLRESGMGGAEL